MTIFLTCTFLALTERNTAMALRTSVTLFRRRRRSPPSGGPFKSQFDSENGVDMKSPGLTTDAYANDLRSGTITPRPDFSNDVFTWSDVNYTIRTADGEEKRLLDNVSGFVAPGKLTALMGESGAGEIGSSSGVISDVLLNRQDDPAERVGKAC